MEFRMKATAPDGRKVEWHETAPTACDAVVMAINAGMAGIVAHPVECPPQLPRTRENYALRVQMDRGGYDSWASGVRA